MSTAEEQTTVAYLGQFSDDPTLKTYLRKILGNSTTLLGVLDYSSASYGSGAAGTYDLLDAHTGSKIVVPGTSVIKACFAYTKTAVTSGGSATLEVGYSGSTAAIFPQTGKASFTLNALIDGTPQEAAANMVVRTADTDVSVTIGTATLTAGKVYFVIELIPIPA